MSLPPSTKKNKQTKNKKEEVKIVPSKAERTIKLGDIVNNGCEVIHIYEDGKLLISSRDKTEVIELKDIK